ncbi:VOC family protein [Nocardioides dubius]|uniref:Glyoxalase-like domain-containing protein n=1 Tax=Nocardioides dubius TaxID=317019 RepID=A0ABN1TZP8_9ACTN
MVTPHWITIFRDLPAEGADAAADYWAAATGTRLSPWRGVHGEFASLLPVEGDPILRVQKVADGPGGVHLDLHVRDPRTAADEAIALGAVEVEDRGYVSLTSPGGIAFCFVSERLSRPPVTDVGGHRTAIDQICLDLPAARFRPELQFWSELTGWTAGSSERHPEFAWFEAPGLPVSIMVQRLGEPTSVARAHLDGRTSDLAAERARQEALGAVVESNEGWLILRDPWGLPYCVIEQSDW